MATIIRKASEYQNFSDFRSDISFFVHNCSIMNGFNATVMSAANTLKTYVDEDIDSITACSECYSNEYHDSKGAFNTLCSKMHSVVWAKSEDFDYWPAKLMNMCDGMAKVRYFGDHTADSIPVEHCCDFKSYTQESEPSDALRFAIKVCYFI